MLKILGVGLPRTGTASLAAALEILGFKTLHHAPKRIDLDNLSESSFQCYDDVDAVLDAPAAFFWRELVETYRECKVILTYRGTGHWWESIKWHINQIHASGNMAHVHYSDRLHRMIFGSSWPEEWLFKKQYIHHNAVFLQTHCWAVGRPELLTMNICDGGDKWDRLCPFLGVPEPDIPFPWKNRKRVDG